MWQFDASNPQFLTLLSEHKDKSPTIGFSLLPKTIIDVNKHEVSRGVRLLNDGTWHHVSFVRKPKNDTKF
jgi:hypothetical protein